MTKNEAQIVQFEKSLKKLGEVLEMIKNTHENHDIFRDSAIQRFEIAFDLCWKTLKEYLREKHGIETASPKKVFQESFKQGVIDNEDVWLTMTDMRNETTHAYDELFAEKVLVELPNIYSSLEKLLWILKK
jgi:nucleotidyltransferase substrate binding protein (TIGR01987 family)